MAVWADRPRGEHEPHHRQAVLGRLADGIDEDSWDTEPPMPTNAPVLDEGSGSVSEARLWPAGEPETTQSGPGSVETSRPAGGSVVTLGQAPIAAE